MNEMEIELNEADQTASTEANAADATNNGDTSEEDSLIDYVWEDLSNISKHFIKFLKFIKC